MKEIVENAFNGYLKTTFKHKKPEIYKLLKNHDRKHLCIENLVVKIKSEDLSGKVFTREKIQYLGKEFAKKFSENVLEYERQRAMTRLQKSEAAKEYVDPVKREQELVDEGVIERTNTDTVG